MLPDWQRSGCTIQMFSRRFYYAETVGWWKTTEGSVPSHTTAWPTHCISPHFFKCLRQQGNCWKRDISSHSEHEKKKKHPSSNTTSSRGRRRAGWQPILDHFLLKDQKQQARTHCCLNSKHAASSPNWQGWRASGLCHFIKRSLRRKRMVRREWKLEANRLHLQSLSSLHSTPENKKVIIKEKRGST